MHKARTFVVCAGLLGLALLLPRPAAADWPTDPNVNAPLCTATGEQYSPTIISDGAGGAIVVWEDYRSGTDYDIYAQRISADGTVQWTADGVALCTATGNQYASGIISDGAGGAIVTWMDYRSGGGNWDIYAQRISAAGTVQWTADGVALCTATGDQRLPAIVSDGVNGAIVAWEDYRNGNNSDIYAQRISADGTPLWAANSVALCTATGGQYDPAIASDDAGGAVVTWPDARSGMSNGDIYVQRISSTGSVQWAADGVALCTDTDPQSAPTIVSDGAGGAIIAWEDYRSGYHGIYAQRISGVGAVQWLLNGVALRTPGEWLYPPTMVVDGAGGAIVTWMDSRSTFDWDIYAQRISAAGTVQWTADAVALRTDAIDPGWPTIVSDGAGGAIVTWCETRTSSYDIYAQRISGDGTLQWTADGVALCAAIGEQSYPTIASDGVDGAIVTWHDLRSGDCQGCADIYAQRVLANGQLGGDVADVPGEASLTFALDPVRPNPSRGGALTVRFSLPTAAPARLELLDVAGRRIASREVDSGQHTLDLGAGQHLAPGLYLVRLTQGANTRVTRVAVLR
jgi:predicted lipoprotein with Yx(FWY)xxD motif